MPETPSSIRAFIEHEAALRSMHGEGALYVKPLVYENGRQTIVVGGWVFLDGEPAMIPDGLTLITIGYETPALPMHTLARDPKAVLALLGGRVETHEAPCRHFTVTVRESEKPALFAQIEALPEHDPGPRAVPSAFDSPAPQRPPDEGGVGGWILVGLMALVIVGVALAMFFR